MCVTDNACSIAKVFTHDPLFLPGINFPIESKICSRADKEKWGGSVWGSALCNTHCTCCSFNSKCISEEKLLSYGMWHHVVSCKCTDVSEEPTASIISADDFAPKYMGSHPLRRQSSYPPPMNIATDVTMDQTTSHSQIIANQWCQTSLPTHEIGYDNSEQQLQAQIVVVQLDHS